MRYYLLILGLCLNGFGLKLMYQRISFLLCSKKTYGKLSGLKEWKNPARPNFTYYNMEIVFEASDGSEHRITSDTASSNKPTLPIGSLVAVRYNPSNPDEAHIDSCWYLWAPSLVFLLMGSVAIFAFLHPNDRPRPHTHHLQTHNPKTGE